MWYIDVTEGEDRYRGVYFTQYRPYYTSYSSSADLSNQDDNGYNINTVYWFKYEPLTWTVLKNADGKAMIVCDYLIDSQAYENTTYSNNYKNSSIRQWLNNDFYNTAFNEAEKEYIATTVVDNSARSTNPNNNATQWNNGNNSYACENTNDKIFLLSEQEVTNSAYGFNADYSNCDTFRRKQTTAYAQAQGASTSTITGYEGNGWWWLRSKHYYRGGGAHGVDYNGDAFSGGNLNYGLGGIVPALQILVD